jgi:hypothetical protein
MINHACSPNVNAHFEGSHVYIRAIKDIMCGSVLRLCYGAEVSESALCHAWYSEEQYLSCAVLPCKDMPLGRGEVTADVIMVACWVENAGGSECQSSTATAADAAVPLHMQMRCMQR